MEIDFQLTPMNTLIEGELSDVLEVGTSDT